MTKDEIYGVDTFTYLLLKEIEITKFDLKLLEKQKERKKDIFMDKKVSTNSKEWMDMEEYMKAYQKARKSKLNRLELLETKLKKKEN
jgi:hypothetical protein